MNIEMTEEMLKRWLDYLNTECNRLFVENEKLRQERDARFHADIDAAFTRTPTREDVIAMAKAAGMRVNTSKGFERMKFGYRYIILPPAEAATGVRDV